MMKQVLLMISMLIIAAAAVGETEATRIAEGKMDYARYCSSCHGNEGQGRDGPALIGNKVVTGPIEDHIKVVLHGKRHTMPSWGITEISDATLAKIITYQRSAWGNDNKTKYGKNAGGSVTPKQIHQYRKELPMPVKDQVRT